MMLFTDAIDFHNERGRDDRFTYAKAVFNGQPVFIKKATELKLGNNVQAERIWCDFMTYVTESFDQTLSSPKLLQVIDNDTLMFEFIDAAHLSELNQLEPWQRNLVRYADMLVTLDTAAQEWQPTMPSDGRNRGRTTVSNWYEWLGNNAPRVRRLEEAIAIMNKFQSSVQTCMQHGDLTPWQIFDNNGQWIVYDGEHSGSDHGRYQDLAYGYGRLSTILRSPQTAEELLRLFIAKSGVDEETFSAQFLPVMLGRAVGMLSDAYNDEPVTDYIAEAERLLDRCLRMDLQALLSDRD